MVNLLNKRINVINLRNNLKKLYTFYNYKRSNIIARVTKPRFCMIKIKSIIKNNNDTRDFLCIQIIKRASVNTTIIKVVLLRKNSNLYISIDEKSPCFYFYL